MNTLDEKIDLGRRAQKVWAWAPMAERVCWLKNFRKMILKNSGTVADAIYEDTGKPLTEAVGIEISTVLMTAEYYEKHAEKFLKTREAKPHLLFKNKRVYVRRLPFGVVGILGPSNLPFSLTLGDAIPALMAGNAVIIKPSEWTPRAARIGVELALKAGLPEGVLQVAEGTGEIGAELVEKVDFVFFTGSTVVGRKVAQRCGSLLKPCVLELGGKAPMIVLEDADIERAAQACVWGRFAHSGQHCIAVERVYVDKKIAEPFIKKVVELTEKLDPKNLSPLTVPGTDARLQSLIIDAVQKGAKIIFETSHKEEGPTILADVHDGMRVMREEAFGPLLPIATFETTEEAFQEANDSESGLSAYLFTRNKNKGLNLARFLEAGSVAVNDCLDQFMVMDAPFGGWKQSGLGGVRHGGEGLLQFTRPQTILVHAWPWPFFRRREFWWFPYSKWTERLLKTLNRLFFR